MRTKLVFVGIFGLLLFLSLNRHSKHPQFTYHSTLFCDKAGYHVYLPLAFYYDFKASNFPEDIRERTGRGFKLDSANDHIITKYPIGVAVMHSPFFALGCLIDKMSGVQQDLGYTLVQHRMVNISSVFYATLGLYLLFCALRRRFDTRNAVLTLLLIVLCSNLYYYITRDVGLSHAYSFFAFSALVFLLEKLNANRLAKQLMWLVFVAGIIIAIRPVNLVFLAMVVLIYWDKLKILSVNKPNVKAALTGLVLLLPIFVAQFAYYRYAFDATVSYSYKGEGFTFLTNPQVLRVWFAPENGLFLYSPVFFLILYGIYKQYKLSRFNGSMYLGLFVVVTMVYATWWSPGLGCGYGHRGFIEHLPVFSLPLALVIGKAHWSRWSTKLISIFFIAFAIYAFYYQFTYDGCWHGDGAWDWRQFLND